MHEIITLAVSKLGDNTGDVSPPVSPYMTGWWNKNEIYWYTLYIIPQLCCPTLQQALHVFGRVQLASQGAQFVANHLLWAPDTQDWVSERDWERASLGQGPSILYYNREPVSGPPIGPHSPSQASDWLGATLLVSAVAIMTRPDTPCLPGVAVHKRHFHNHSPTPPPAPVSNNTASYTLFVWSNKCKICLRGRLS